MLGLQQAASSVVAMELAATDACFTLCDSCKGRGANLACGFVLKSSFRHERSMFRIVAVFGSVTDLSVRGAAIAPTKLSSNARAQDSCLHHAQPLPH